MKIIFAGTPDFAADILKSLLQAQFNIIAVYTQPDRPSGRGRTIQYSPVKQIAQNHNIPVEQPSTLKTLQAQEHLAHYQADLMIVVAYGLILPKEILKTPKLGCLNIHASLLPRWRGAAPIQRAILAGDHTTGITLMQMDEGLDTGPILATAECRIIKHETTPTLFEKLLKLTHPLLQLTLHNWPKTAQPQDHTQACYADKLTKIEGLIDWDQPVAIIDRKIRGLIPWPVTYTYLHSGEIVRIWAAEPMVDDNQPTRTPACTPGTIIQNDKTGITVQCQQGCLKLTQLQLPGGRVLQAHELLNSRFKSSFACNQKLGAY